MPEAVSSEQARCPKRFSRFSSDIESDKLRVECWHFRRIRYLHTFNTYSYTPGNIMGSKGSKPQYRSLQWVAAQPFRLVKSISFCINLFLSSLAASD